MFFKILQDLVALRGFEWNTIEKEILRWKEVMEMFDLDNCFV